LLVKSARYATFDPLRFIRLPPRSARKDRQSLIAQAAYFLAERRHFQPGHELEDWLAAEAEVDRRLANARAHGDDATGG